MQYTLSINQTKALEWGLNSQQAVLFSFVYECPSWCKPVTKGDVVFYTLSKQKIVDELPLLTDKPDTAYRMLKQLEAKGVIEVSHTNNITLVRLTDLGKTWNHDHTGSEKSPSKGRKNIRSKVGKKSEQGRKIIREGSEKSPTNQDTSNQDTSNPVDAGASSSSAPVADHPPVDPDEQAHQDAIFGHEDSGPLVPATAPAVPNRASRDVFEMHHEWQPSELDVRRHMSRQVALLGVERIQQELDLFRLHYDGAPARRQGQWVKAFVSWLNRARPDSPDPQAAVMSRQQKRAAVSEAIMNVNDTDW